MKSAVTELAQALIQRPSISPEDAGCQQLLIEQLKPLGFTIESLPFGDTQNFWAYHGQGKTLAFAGHTDVVPCGDETQWHYPPFSATVSNGYLYGRGAADMKGSLAAMIIAARQFIQSNPHHSGRLAFLVTSDEEASAINGTRKVVDTLLQRGDHIDYCLVGEPSSDQRLGDVVKNGRRGSITGDLTIHGVQGHVAYPHLAKNPIHHALPFLATLVNHRWDQGNDFFPPTSLQIANIQAGTGSNNVIPGDLFVQFNLRFSTETSIDKIKQQVALWLDEQQLQHTLLWQLSGSPFLTPSGELVDAVVASIEQCQAITPQLLTTGGTSDGRFIAQMKGCQVVELGPCNATIHKINECVAVNELEQLTNIYQQIMQRLLS